MVWVLSFKQKVFGLYWCFFWGWNIKVTCTTRLCSSTAPFSIICNDLPHTLSDTGSYLYADDTCIFYQHEDINKIENVLNEEFSSLCQWFIDNKLSIHFGEDETKSILFSKTRDLREINISFADHSIKQHETVEYLGCQLDSKLRGEVAWKVVKKITWVFVSELSGCGFKSSSSHLNFRFRTCFEQGVPWHSGNYRVLIHSETRMWHDKNIQSNALYR